MLMLTNTGVINGISAISIVIIYLGFGIFLIDKSKKTNAKLLYYLGIMNICTGCMYLGICIDFLTILITGNNSNFPYFVQFLLCWMWSPLSGAVALYIATKLLIPKKKWYVISVFLFLVSLLFVFFIFDPVNNVNVVYPPNSGEELIQSQVILGSPASIIILLMIFFTITFNGFGTLFKSIRSRGVIRKKFLSLSIGWFTTLTFVLLEGFLIYSLFDILFKIGMMCALWFFYFGLREEPEKLEEFPSKKEIKVEESLFIISQRTGHLTEEEVSIAKEKKICLVCMGKLSGYNIFMCPACDALYCKNCALALETLENACWVCNAPIDPSKPVKKIIKVTESKPPKKAKKVPTTHKEPPEK
ncbi:MAG: hypothetical protein ACFFDK_01535 [Promethearchaeota archaeon]